MPTTTHLEELKLNVLTQSQFDGATKDPNQFYFITDAPAAAGYTVTDTTSNAITLSNNDTINITNPIASLSVALPTPEAGSDYVCGILFKTSSSSFTFTEQAPTGYETVWKISPTWQSGKVYEIIYRNLHQTNANGNIIISAKWAVI